MYHSFQLQNEVKVENFLGIRIDKRVPTELHLTQRGLKEKVNQAGGMENADGVNTPTKGEPSWWACI